MIVEFILFLVAVAMIWHYLSTKPEKYPPGPFKWPLVGSWLQMKLWGTMPHLSMAEAARRYGDLVGLYTGDVPVILISNAQDIIDIFSKEGYAARPRSKLIEAAENGSFGIIFDSGEKWKEQRRFTLRHLRDLGFGKRSLEGIAHEELEAMFAAIEKLSGGHKRGWSDPVPVYDIMGTAGINVLWQIVTGKRYSHGDPRVNKLLRDVRRLMMITEADGGMATALPLLTKMFPRLSNIHEMLKLRKTFQNFVKEEIEKHKEYIDNENPRDFIEQYLSELDKNKEEILPWHEERQLVQICVDLFTAGSDTSFKSLTFSLLYMVLHPDVQRKVQEELDRVVGRDRLPSLDDRTSLPYVEATLHEMLRKGSVVPWGVPHTSWYIEKDVELKGYVIPKNSILVFNLYTIHHDSDIWGDPETFRPERFLDENGKVIKHKALMPFGIGNRVCLAETMARNNIFLFFAGILQNYSIGVPNGHQPPSEDTYGGFTNGPVEFQAQFQPRR